MAGKHSESGKSRDPSLQRDELIGVSTAVLALLVMASLATYSPRDPGFFTSAGGTILHNKLRLPGAFFADALISSFGYLAFALPAFLAWVAAGYLLRRGWPIRAGRATGLALLFVAVSGFLNAVVPVGPRPWAALPGGYLGSILWEGLGDALGGVGAALILVLFFLAGLVLGAGVSVTAAARTTGGLVARAATGVADSFGMIVQRLRRRRERKSAEPRPVRKPKVPRAAEPEPEPEEGEEEEPTAPAWEAPRISTPGPRAAASVPEEEPDAPEEPPTAEATAGPSAEPAPRDDIRVVERSEGKPTHEPAKPKPFALPFPEFAGEYELPPTSLLDQHPDARSTVDRDLLMRNSRALEEKLAHFNVDGKVVEVRPGPIVTMYEFEPAPGVRVTTVANLEKDLALALKASRIRIVAPLPERGTIGIEVPNRDREIVYLREILESPEFQDTKAKIPIAIGKDIFGRPAITDLTEMPHLLVAGTTGSGKSVFLNCVVLSLLYRHTPTQVRILLVDPKMLEFQDYDGIPSLLLPVVTNTNKASAVLRQAVDEMERRYRLMADMGVRDLEGYNAKVEKKNQAPEMKRVYSSDEEGRDIVDEEPILIQRLPYIVLIIDEFADLMMVAPKDIMESVQRLAQMARAAGIHLILATQRPSKDVITGDIKANMAARITFQLRTKIDSRVILDCNGAEALLGMGDMLFLPSKNPKLQRLHGAYVSEREIKRVIEFVQRAGGPVPVETLFTEEAPAPDAAADNGEFFDEKYEDAKRLVNESERATISYVQRILKIGYNRAARMIEQMERDGLISPPDHTGMREIYHERF